MGTSTRIVPEGYRTVTPWIIVRGAAELLDYVRDAFGAEERVRIEMGRRAGDPANLEGMRCVQGSLDDEMRSTKK